MPQLTYLALQPLLYLKFFIYLFIFLFLNLVFLHSFLFSDYTNGIHVLDHLCITWLCECGGTLKVLCVMGVLLAAFVTDIYFMFEHVLDIFTSIGFSTTKMGSFCTWITPLFVPGLFTSMKCWFGVSVIYLSWKIFIFILIKIP